MSVITVPTALPVAASGGFTWGQRRFDLVTSSDATGATQVRPMGPPRWTVSMNCPAVVTNAQAGEWQSMLLRLRGRVNHLAVFDAARPYPRGTARGTMFLKVAASAGATTAAITGAGISGTLLKGDKLQISTGVGTSQLVQIVSDATSVPSSQVTVTWTNTAAQTVTWTNSAAQTVTWARTGTISITFEPPLRYSFQAGTSVTWSKPVAYFKATNDSSQWAYWSPDLQQGYSFDGIEDWTP